MVHEYFTDASSIQSKAFDSKLDDLNKSGVYVVMLSMDGKNYFTKLTVQ